MTDFAKIIAEQHPQGFAYAAGFGVVNQDLRIVYWSEGATRIFGCDRTGQQLSTLSLMSDSAAERTFLYFMEENPRKSYQLNQGDLVVVKNCRGKSVKLHAGLYPLAVDGTDYLTIFFEVDRPRQTFFRLPLLPTVEETERLGTNAKKIIALLSLVGTFTVSFFTSFLQLLPPIQIPTFYSQTKSTLAILKDKKIIRELAYLKAETRANRVFLGFYRTLNGLGTVYTSSSLEAKEAFLSPLETKYRELAKGIERDKFLAHQSEDLIVVLDSDLLAEDNQLRILMNNRENRSSISKGFIIYPLESEENTVAFVQMNFPYALSGADLNSKKALLESRVKEIKDLVNAQIISMAGGI